MSREVPEVRIAGRGGQGVVTAGELLGLAVVLEGRYAQAMPAFGPERRGALATCTLRVSDGEILLSTRAYTAVEDLVEAEPPMELTLKGFHEPVEAYRVTASGG